MTGKAYMSIIFFTGILCSMIGVAVTTEADFYKNKQLNSKNHTLDSTIQSYREDKFAWKVHQDQESRTQVMTIYKFMNDPEIEVIFKRAK